ncbi:MAG: hypothetical protein KAX49_14785 [Halanaerobiales bacterium]|nr:hypothetical protein [Halanaerobiales bacterium]
MPFLEIIKNIHDGIYITNISNLYTGVDRKNGEITEMAKKIFVSGNLINLLQEISLIGDDLYFDPICEGFGCPTFVVDKLQI